MRNGKVEAGDAIILVHGTFARGAAWVQSGSMLCEELSKNFPGALIVPFQWSGENSHGSRKQAGDGLAKFIQEIGVARPSATIHLVGHSHGGNVMHHAIAAMSNQTQIGTLTFFGTPFFHVAPRSSENNLKRLFRYISPIYNFFIFLLALFLAVIVLGSIMGIASAILEVDPAAPGDSIGGQFTILLGLGLAIYLWPWFGKCFSLAKALQLGLYRRLCRSVRSARYELFQAVQHCSPTQPSFFAVAKGDEARMWLAGLDGFATAPWVAWSIITRLFALIGAGLAFVFSLGGPAAGIVLALIASVTPWVLPDRPAEIDSGGIMFNFLVVLFVLMSGLFLLGILLFVVFVGVSVLLRGTKYGFGWEGVLGSAALEIVPKASPPWQPVAGSMWVHYKPETRLWGLRHCAFYDDSKLIATLVGWLKASVEPGPLNATPELKRSIGSRLSSWLLPAILFVALILLVLYLAQRQPPI